AQAGPSPGTRRVRCVRRRVMAIRSGLLARSGPAFGQIAAISWSLEAVPCGWQARKARVSQALCWPPSSLADEISRPAPETWKPPKHLTRIRVRAFLGFDMVGEAISSTASVAARGRGVRSPPGDCGSLGSGAATGGFPLFEE